VFAAELSPGHGGRLDVDVDAVDQRATDAAEQSVEEVLRRRERGIFVRIKE